MEMETVCLELSLIRWKEMKDSINFIEDKQLML